MIQLSIATPRAIPAGTLMPYLACRLSLAQTTNPAATATMATTIRDNIQTPWGTADWTGCGSGWPGLERAETDAAYFLGADFDVAQDVRRDDDLAALLIGQAEFGALGNGLAHKLRHRVGVLVRFQRNFAADVLNADLYFHSKASQPIKVFSVFSTRCTLFVV